MNFIKICFLVVFCHFVIACSSAPKSTKASDTASNQGEAIARIAVSMVGVDYLYGGSNPSQGFDCSGLVFYSHNKVGLEVDRTAYRQYQASRAVNRKDLSKGDLLFYKIDGKPSHVAIYIGNGQFVHAPSSGKKVSISSISNPFFQDKLLKIGRFHASN